MSGAAYFFPEACLLPTSAFPTNCSALLPTAAMTSRRRSSKACIPSVLMGRDLIGIAQTGTGKTAGFVLPMIDILARGPQPRADAALADPRADPRTGRAGRREFRQIRQISQALDGAADRRRSDGRPDQGARKGRRRADRDAGPADGPVRPRQDHAQRLRTAGHRRSRPDARHGLHPRHRGNLFEIAQVAPDPAVFGDDAAADPEVGGQVPERSQEGRGRPAGHRQRQYRPAPRVGDAPTRSAMHFARSCAPTGSQRHHLLQPQDHGPRA